MTPWIEELAEMELKVEILCSVLNTFYKVHGVGRRCEFKIYPLRQEK